jgi:hypothetical protein
VALPIKTLSKFTRHCILDSILDYNDFLWSYVYCYFVQVIDMWYLEFFSESSPSQVSTLHKKCGAQLNMAAQPRTGIIQFTAITLSGFTKRSIVPQDSNGKEEEAW